MNNTLWFDVTTLLNWRRPPVGIVRVEMECAAYAKSYLYDKVKFCCYKGQGHYLQISYDEIQNTLNILNGSIKEDLKNTEITADTYGLAKTPFYNRAAAVTRRLLSHLPAPVGDNTLNYLQVRKEAVFAGISGLREIRRAWRIWRNPSLPDRQRPLPIKYTQHSSLFKRGDVYISLGLDWQQKYLPFIMELKLLNKFKTLFMSYDVIPIKFPQYCIDEVAAYFPQYIADLTWCADMVGCISKSSEYDLQVALENLGAPPPKTFIVKLGCVLQNTCYNLPYEIQKSIGNKFILYVSTLERRKNHETLYKAYTRLIEEGYNNLPQLICVGMIGWHISDFLFELSTDRKIKDHIVILENITDYQLTWFYKNCLFTVFPSLYEGWGLAVAESLAAGKFCLSSNKGALREVGGDFVEYLDPWDVPLWAERIAFYSKNADQLCIAEKKIKDNYIPQTWQNTAHIIFEQAGCLCAQ
jgi:glycosyltransferase involved in cell wall biosynthesis